MRFILTVLLFLATGTAFAQDVRPPLWKLADADTTIYLFGTIHLLKPGTAWMTDRIQSALDGSSTLYLEVSLAEQRDVAKIQALVRKHGMLPAGQTLSGSLPPDLGEELVSGLTGLGLKREAVERFKPWFAGMTLANLKFVHLGYNTQSGVEAALGGAALTRDIPVAGLETLDFQLGMFDAMSEEETVAYIKDLLDEQEGLSAMMTDVTTSWSQGDLKALNDEINDMVDLSPELAERILYARNRNWAGEIAQMLEEPGQVFIAVGSGHFVGERSVIEYLEEKGLTVTRVQ
jgi:uncharacterized protein YbaP (TraB family)